MSYKVIHYFEDLQDFNHPYKVGDIFPRLGMTASEERIRELSTNRNKQKKPLIAKVDEQKDFVADNKVIGQIDGDVIEVTDKEIIKENTLTKTDVNRMSTAELRELATANGIKNANETTGGELKKLLIGHFGL